jgi:hypothetical protein
MFPETTYMRSIFQLLMLDAPLLSPSPVINEITIQVPTIGATYLPLDESR